MKILSHKKNEKDRFELLCRKTFKFLETDFDCKVDSVERDVYGTRVIYKNLNIVAEVDFTPMDGYVSIKVFPLTKSPCQQKMPKRALRGFYLSDIVSAYDACVKFEIPLLKQWENYSVLKKALTHRARLLKKYAADILRGDFSILPKVEKIIKSRAKTGWVN